MTGQPQGIAFLGKSFRCAKTFAEETKTNDIVGAILYGCPDWTLNFSSDKMIFTCIYKNSIYIWCKVRYSEVQGVLCTYIYL